MVPWSQPLTLNFKPNPTFSSMRTYQPLGQVTLGQVIL